MYLYLIAAIILLSIPFLILINCINSMKVTTRTNTVVKRNKKNKKVTWSDDIVEHILEYSETDEPPSYSETIGQKI